MSYKSDTVATILARLNSQYFIPAIQREFVWLPDQIISLFDSLMRRYPIGSFLFWELQPENRDKWDIYRFVENARQGGTHNETANPAGVQHMNLVLDGQQRLTSLLIGLRGTYTTKRKYKRWGDPDAWVHQRLYLDLLKDPAIIEDGESGVRYGFAFFETPPANDSTHHWLEAGRILDFDNEDRFDEFRDAERATLPEDATLRQANILQRNLDRLYRAIWKDESVAHYTETDQDYDRVLDIFVRANEGGTKLSKSDLLLSMVTSKWIGTNARDEIFDFVDRINGELQGKNNFTKDFVLKTALVVTDLPLEYKVQNFNNQNLAVMQQNWDHIRSAIERSVNLVNSFGIDRDTLLSANAVIPVIYFLYQVGHETLLGNSAFEDRNARSIRNWLVACLLNNVFGGAPDTILREIRRVLREQVGGTKDFPAAALRTATAQSNRSSEFDEYAVSDVLAIRYGQRNAFLALSLLYNEIGWGSKHYHIDHIFPRSLFRLDRMREAGFTDTTWLSYHADSIANLQLLLGPENQEKSDQEFESWLATRSSDFRRRHLIPEDSGLLQFARFEDFLQARRELIGSRLRHLFGGATMSGVTA